MNYDTSGRSDDAFQLHQYETFVTNYFFPDDLCEGFASEQEIPSYKA